MVNCSLYKNQFSANDRDKWVNGSTVPQKTRTFQHRSFEDTEQEHQCSQNDVYQTVSGKENETNGEKETQTVETKGFTKVAIWNPVILERPSHLLQSWHQFIWIITSTELQTKRGFSPSACGFQNHRLHYLINYYLLICLPSST